MNKYSTIMIADDDIDLVENLAFLIKTMGHDVVIANDGWEAVAKYKDFRPTITLMDLKMPRLDGYEAFFKIKEHDNQAKVVFMSAYHYDESRYLKAKSMSLLDSINKPFSFTQLQSLLQKHLPIILE